VVEPFSNLDFYSVPDDVGDLLASLKEELLADVRRVLNDIRHKPVLQPHLVGRLPFEARL